MQLIERINQKDLKSFFSSKPLFKDSPVRFRAKIPFNGEILAPYVFDGSDVLDMPEMHTIDASESVKTFLNKIFETGCAQEIRTTSVFHFVLIKKSNLGWEEVTPVVKKAIESL
ncbi:hypothetical protein K8Q94_01765 [Candidatus Nomurabacteria bacterium]|nr:hypothetical protein [Candidatus Nomurabacteria bacterium]